MIPIRQLLNADAIEIGAIVGGSGVYEARRTHLAGDIALDG